jgi:hypothetical protein
LLHFNKLINSSIFNAKFTDGEGDVAADTDEEVDGRRGRGKDDGDGEKLYTYTRRKKGIVA